MLTNSERQMHDAGEHPAVTPKMILELARANDSCLHAIANGGCSMKLFVATLASGDPFTSGGLDLVPRGRYDDLVDAMVRRGIEFRSDFIGGVGVLIVQAAPKVTR